MQIREFVTQSPDFRFSWKSSLVSELYICSHQAGKNFVDLLHSNTFLMKETFSEQLN